MEYEWRRHKTEWVHCVQLGCKTSAWFSDSASFNPMSDSMTSSLVWRHRRASRALLVFWDEMLNLAIQKMNGDKCWDKVAVSKWTKNLLIYDFFFIDDIKSFEKTDYTFQLEIKISLKMVSNLLIVDTIQEFIAADLHITTLKCSSMIEIYKSNGKLPWIVINISYFQEDKMLTHNIM